MSPSRLAPRAARLAALLLVLPLHAVAAQRLAGAHPGRVPAPVLLDATGRFQERFAKVGDDLFIAGQPSEAALRALRDSGVTTIVNLRTPEEMTKNVPFDEAALAASLGMRYVYVPMRGNAEYPYSPEAVTRFADALAQSDGKVLLHCTIAWRASHLWAAYLIARRDVPVDSALAWARAINLMDDMRPSAAGDSPVELFLGRPLPQLAYRAAARH